MLANHIIQSVTDQIHHQFPEVAGCQPKIQLQPAPKGSPTDRPDQYLLIYHGLVEAPAGRHIPRLVRVVVNTRGQVIKVTTSH